MKKILVSAKSVAQGFWRFVATTSTDFVFVALVVGYGIVIGFEGKLTIIIEAAIAAMIPIILIFLSTSVTLCKSY